MSWSVGKTSGNPSAVKKALATQFAYCKRGTQHIPHELATVEAAEALVNSQLDYMIENKCPAVTVDASGSCSTFSATFPGSGTSSVKINVEPIYCFLEDPCPNHEPESEKVAVPAA